jgi:hypothetical protein
MNSRRPSPRLLPPFVALLAALAIVSTATASAQADSPIEGVWTFNGGKVAVTKASSGGFVGTVVSATKFAECTHPVGEEMWTKITPQPDGSYWGLHQWFFETSECVRNPILGLTAWRVLKRGESRYLRVCFSKPDANKQPTIEPNGEALNATYGCINSALVTTLPELKPADFERFVDWPKGKSCIGGKKLRIRISEVKNDPIAMVAVTLKSGKLVRKAKIRTRPGGRLATLSLRGLPKPRFTVTVHLTTVLGSELSRKRHYRLCVAKKPRRRHRHHVDG